MTTKEYNKIVDSYGQRIYSFIFNSLRDSEESKNLVQDTFETLWIKKDSVDISKTKSYLFTIAYRKMVDHTRRNKTMVNYLSNMQVGIQQNSEQELNAKHLLKKAFMKIREEYKRVILLRDSEGYSYDEIAKITGQTAGQVRTNLFRGRKELRTIIERLESFKI